MNAELRPTKPLGTVAVQADHVLPGHVAGEGELALAAVHLGQDDLVVRVPDLHMHSYLWTRSCKPVSSRIIQLNFVISCKTLVKKVRKMFLILPVTMVSSGISSMKHFLSVSPM